MERGFYWIHLKPARRTDRIGGGTRRAEIPCGSSNRPHTRPDLATWAGVGGIARAGSGGGQKFRSKFARATWVTPVGGNWLIACYSCPRRHRRREIPFLVLLYLVTLFNILCRWDRFWIPFLSNIPRIVLFAFLFLRFVHTFYSHLRVPGDGSGAWKKIAFRLFSVSGGPVNGSQLPSVPSHQGEGARDDEPGQLEKRKVNGFVFGSRSPSNQPDCRRDENPQHNTG